MLITQKIINELTYNIIGACIEVHKLVGPGLYETVYHKCLEKEFILRNISFKSELEIPFNYKGEQIGCKVKCEFLIENLFNKKRPIANQLDATDEQIAIK